MLNYRDQEEFESLPVITMNLVEILGLKFVLNFLFFDNSTFHPISGRIQHFSIPQSNM